MSHNKFLDEVFSEITLLGTPVFYIVTIVALIAFHASFVWKLFFSLIFIELLCALIKLIYKKGRPEPQSYKGLFSRIDSSSFPSVHSARISFLATMVIFNYRNASFIIACILIAAAVGYSRVYLRRHYFVDVIFGFLIGALTGFIVFYL